jgi:ABC-type transport system involved in multi-copper enzyme maturation permease subunit
MTFRFFVATFICLLLVVSNSIVLIKDYERRLAHYNTAVQTHRNQAIEAPVYSCFRLYVDRPPNPMSIFNQGMDKRLGNTIRVDYSFVPCLWDAQLHGSENSFLDRFSSIDLTFIFQVVLSLLALLFAYDAITGERESGVLRLTMANPVSRSLILLAKYISAMVCLMVPLIISLLLAQILFVLSGKIALSNDDWLRIGGILLTSIVYLSAFYLTGLLISAASRRSATALMLSMFAWVFLVLVYPNLSVFIVNRFWRTEAELKSGYEEIKQIWEGYEQEREDFLRNDLVEGEAWPPPMRIDNFADSPGESDSTTLLHYRSEEFNLRKLYGNSENMIPHMKAYYQFTVPLRIRTAEKAWLARQRALKQISLRKAEMAKNIMRFSPAVMYDLATAAWASTDLREMEHFITQVQQHRHTLIAYFRDKDAFSSRHWFASDKGKVSWDDLPQFSYYRADVWISARHALSDLAVLLVINVVLFMMTFMIFMRQEV